MNRPIAFLGATSSIGIRPYDNGAPRQLDRAPAMLRELHLVERLGAIDLGDVAAPPYRDYVRPPARVRNEAELEEYCRSLGGRIAEAMMSGHFVLLAGGDCSIVLGALLGGRHTTGRPVGLVYVDAHADFATPETSLTGSAASMCLAMAVGRGDTPLARLGGSEVLARPEHVALIGRRDHEEGWYGHDALAASGILDLADAAIREHGAAAAGRRALDQVARADSRSFWIHVDADVFDPAIVAAVDSPIRGGLHTAALAELLAPLIAHPGALGLELTIYDPALDPQRTSARHLGNFLAEVLR